jgi:hypothetical protein
MDLLTAATKFWEPIMETIRVSMDTILKEKPMSKYTVSGPVKKVLKHPRRTGRVSWATLPTAELLDAGPLNHVSYSRLNAF